MLLLDCIITAANAAMTSSGGDAARILQDDPAHVTALVGQNVTLKCRIRKSFSQSKKKRPITASVGGKRREEKASMVAWKKLRENVYCTYNAQSYMERFHSGFQDAHTIDLHIYNVRFSDEGAYMCLFSANKAYELRTVNLTVFSKPEIARNSANKAAIFEGSQTKLICKTYGRPRPSVIWEYGDEQFTPSFQIHNDSRHVVLPPDTLILRNVSRQQNEPYTCVAKNKYGTTRHKFELKIKFKPSVSMQQPLIRQNTGHNTVIVAQIEAYEMIKIKWLLNGREIIIMDEVMNCETSGSSTHYTNEKNCITLQKKSKYTWESNLWVYRIEDKDFGVYTSRVYTTMGNAEAHTNLDEVPKSIDIEKYREDIIKKVNQNVANRRIQQENDNRNRDDDRDSNGSVNNDGTNINFYESGNYFSNDLAFVQNEENAQKWSAQNKLTNSCNAEYKLGSSRFAIILVMGGLVSLVVIQAII